ncbi:putative drug antiporter protein precursor [Ktedonobacter sp. SOSP1-85]|nr:putative drug antiporter protein precursor [Ktedonobacter sp. SOSP1-85]
MGASMEQEKNLQAEQNTELPEKRSLPIYALFLANTVSLIGDRLMFIAIPWLVLQTTGSASKAGITAFFEMLAVVLSSFFGSQLLDKLGFKRVSILGDVASGIAVMLIPLCYETIGLSFWQLQVLVFLAGLLMTPGSSARYALLPDLIKLSRMPAERANSLYDGVSRVSGFFGAPLAGVLILVIGTSNLLWVDGVTFFFSALLLAWSIPASKAKPREQGQEQGNYLQNLKEGLTFLRRTPVMFAIAITIMITNMLDQGMSGVLLPSYGQKILESPVSLGWLSAAWGGAAFAGTLLFAAIGHRLPRRLTFGLCFCFSTILRFFALALGLPLPILIVSYAIGGVAIGPINPILSTMEQELVPAELRARVFGALTAMAFLGMPIGGLVAGFLVDWLGITPGILIFGCIYLLSTISLLFNPSLKGMDQSKRTTIADGIQ